MPTRIRGRSFSEDVELAADKCEAVMKVLHVLDAPYGGATAAALELMRFSIEAESGIEHYVVYPGLEGKTDPRIGLFCHGHASVPIRWWHVKKGLKRLERASLWCHEMLVTGFGFYNQKLMEQLVREWKIDLVHTNSSAVLAGARVARPMGLPHVWHIRERIGSGGAVQFALSDRRLAKRIGSLSTKITPVSHFAAELFLDHGLGPKTEIVYDGICVEDFDSHDARHRGSLVRQAWGIPANCTLIGNVGGFAHRIKRHDIFVKASGILARRDPSLRFVAVGVLPRNSSLISQGENEYFASLRALVRQEGIEERFTWVPVVGDNGAVMNAIDILCHACSMEGFGRVAIESMAAGKPVVGPAMGGLTESVVDGQTGFLVKPEDPGALADATERVIRDQSLYSRFSEEGHRHVVQHFSSDLYLQQMKRIYLWAVRGAGSRIYKGLV